MKRSLQLQLLSAVLLAEALLAGGLLVVAHFSVKNQLLSGMNSALMGRAMSVAALVRYSEDNSSTLEFDRGLTPKPLDSHFPDAYEIFGPDHNLLVRSEYWPQELGSGSSLPTGFWQRKVRNRELRGVRMDEVPILDAETGTPISPATLTVIYATPTRAMRQRLAATTRFIGVAAFLFVVVTGIFAWILLRRSLSLVREVASAAQRISAQQWRFDPPALADRVTELRPLVESLRQMVDGLHRSFDSQRDFISNAAHELKTPVAIQKSTLQLLLHHDLTAAEYKHGLQQALRDTIRIEDLLQRLLRLARAEHNATAASSRDLHIVELSASCEAAFGQIQPYATSRRIILQLVHNGSACVEADSDDLVVVWINLLENAIRFSPEGATVVVKIDATNGRNAIVTVEDQGCGIPWEHQKRIFERFYRGDESRTRDTGGAGLGLAMVKTLVEAYQGTVSVESTEDQGATFTVSLPLAST